VKALDDKHKRKCLGLQRISMDDERSVKIMFYSKYSRVLFLVLAIGIAAINAAGQSDGGGDAPTNKWSYHADDGANFLDYTILQRANGFEVTGQFRIGGHSRLAGFFDPMAPCTISGSYLTAGRRLRAVAHCAGSATLQINGDGRLKEDAFNIVVLYNTNGFDQRVSLIARRPGAKPSTNKDNSDEKARIDLSGTWTCNDGGTYKITQAGDSISWKATSSDGGKEFSHHFDGKIEGDTIKGHYKDDPSGRVHQEGDLEFKLNGSNQLTLQKHSVPFGCSLMTKNK
jgi:hypothetical protein